MVLGIALTGVVARQLRLRSQHLDARATIDVKELVRSIAAVQAQDTFAESLAVRVRADSATEDAVEEARVRDRSVVRTWAMRGTLHLLPAEDVRWILRLVGLTAVRKFQRRHRELGLSKGVLAGRYRDGSSLGGKWCAHATSDSRSMGGTRPARGGPSGTAPAVPSLT